MSVEWWNETENTVEKGRSSAMTYGGIKPILDDRVRQALMTKEPLCGNQPTNLSLVIVVLDFPSCFAVLLFLFLQNKEVFIEYMY